MSKTPNRSRYSNLSPYTRLKDCGERVKALEAECAALRRAHQEHTTAHLFQVQRLTVVVAKILEVLAVRGIVDGGESC